MCRRSSRWWHDLGDFYVVDLGQNATVDGHVDPAAHGRELGVIEAFEQVVDDA